MGKFNKISSDAFSKIQFGAGMVLTTFDPESPVEPTDETIVCATTGGITITATPSYVDVGDDIDNCPKNTLELKKIESWETKMTFTSLGVTAETIKLALGAADTSGNKTTPRAALASTDFAAIWWVGETMNGGLVAAKLLNALSTGGLSIKTEDNGKAQLSVELTGHVSISAQDVVPIEFYAIESVTEESGT